MLLAAAAVCAGFALAVWWVFLRPVPCQSAWGAVVSKVFKPASTYWQYPTGPRRNFWTPARIPIAECFVFAIRLDGRPTEAWFSLNTTAARSFDVGQRVLIDYQVRGIPGIWQRVCVTGMRRAEGN